MANFQKYTSQPEFKPFFYLIPLAIAIAVVNFVYLPVIFAAGTFAILFIIMAIFGASAFKLSKASIEVGLKTSQIQSIISYLNVGVIAYDNDFNVTLFNPAAREIFRLSDKDVIGVKLTTEMASDKRFKILVQSIFSSLAPTVIKKSEPGAYPQIADITFDDPVLEIHVVTDRVLDSNGNTSGFIKLVTDNTREKDLLKAKTEFISVAAHQLRTPLTSINWAFEALESSGNLPPENKEIVDTGFAAAQKMLKSVNDLLDVSKMEEGKFGYEFEDVDLTDYLEEFLSGAENVAKQYGIKIYFQKPKEPISVFIDKQKLSVALSNLMDNAIRYNVENGEVVISAEKEQGRPFIAISIKDTGIGIPQEQIERLFTKFFRADNVTKYAPDGSGLGLYIAKNIIRSHGGEIRVESELNRGSTFFISIPYDKNLVPKKEFTGNN